MMLIILLIVVCETTAISCIKRFHNNSGTKYFLFAVLLYGMVCFLLHQSFYLKDSMGMVNVVWSGISVLAVALTGILIFKEKIHLHDIFAGILIVAGMSIFKYTD
jgi:multidrug transporter EmrE-like cation transporter